MPTLGFVPVLSSPLLADTKGDLRTGYQRQLIYEFHDPFLFSGDA